MTSEEKLLAYEAMHRAVADQYQAACQTMEALKAAGKEKTVAFRTAFGDKLLYKQMLALYQAHGLE